MLKAETEEVKVLARIIAKEETEAMGKGLDEVDKKLEAGIKYLEAEIKKLASARVELSKPDKRR